MTEIVADDERAERRAMILAFPPSRRVSLVRGTARVLATRRTAADADRHRFKVSEALFSELARLGLDEYAQDEAVGAFFDAVEMEMLLNGEAPPRAAPAEQAETSGRPTLQLLRPIQAASQNPAQNNSEPANIASTTGP